MAIIAILLVSIFVCWVFELTSRLDGFLRGCSILAAFSLGSPNPIINSQFDQPQSRPTQSQSRLEFTPAAFAQGAAESTTAQVGDAFIILKHLRSASPFPLTIITVDDSRTGGRIAAYRIAGYRFKVTQPFGTYIVNVSTPGYASIVFNLTIDDSTVAFDVSAPESSLPLGLQKLTTETRVVLQPDESERLKQTGKKKSFGLDFTGAISDYQNALAIDPTDDETSGFLAYALFRAGQLTQAEHLLVILIGRHPDDDTVRINLLKVECSENKMSNAHANFDSTMRNRQSAWNDDGEFMRVCHSLFIQ
jgi:tetratricopeptide (TPR) repeat protein